MKKMTPHNKNGGMISAHACQRPDEKIEPRSARNARRFIEKLKKKRLKGKKTP